MELCPSSIDSFLSLDNFSLLVENVLALFEREC